MWDLESGEPLTDDHHPFIPIVAIPRVELVEEERSLKVLEVLRRGRG